MNDRDDFSTGKMFQQTLRRVWAALSKAVSAGKIGKPGTFFPPC
jgi:hypothetical protein